MFNLEGKIALVTGGPAGELAKEWLWGSPKRKRLCSSRQGLRLPEKGPNLFRGAFPGLSKRLICSAEERQPCSATTRTTNRSGVSSKESTPSTDSSIFW